MRPYIADIAINLWERNLLQQWKTQINIPLLLVSMNETSQAPSKNLKLVRESYQMQSHAVQGTRYSRV